MDVMNKETKEVTEQEVTVDKDECNRPQTTLESLAGLMPVMGPDKYITAAMLVSCQMEHLHVC